MPKFHVERTARIDAPVETVHAVVRDFRNWPAWSPWLIAEPHCDVRFSEDGSTYSWDGRIVGRGGMAVVGGDAPGSIRFRLTFLKPWKSVSDVAFDFRECDGGTEAVWRMDGSLPFFLFWMKAMMTAWIGMDYERGLAMLKDRVETGTVPSHLEFPGCEAFPGCRFVGITTECAIAEVGARMGEDFARLRAGIERDGLEPSGRPFAAYHDWNPGKGTTRFTLGFPLAVAPPEPPPGMVSGEIPACDTYVVRHTGPYRHLGNAWSAGFLHARSRVFRLDRRIAPFEIYETPPGDVPDHEAVTVLHFPVR